MAKKENARMKQMEELREILAEDKKELREILARDREEHQEQMAQIMQVIMKMAREKGTVDDIGSMDTTALTQKVIKGPRYLAASFVMPEARIPHYLIP